MKKKNLNVLFIDRLAFATAEKKRRRGDRGRVVKASREQRTQDPRSVLERSLERAVGKIPRGGQSGSQWQTI